MLPTIAAASHEMRPAHGDRETTVVAAQEEAPQRVSLQTAGGSETPEFNYATIDAVYRGLWTATATEERKKQQETAAMAALLGIAPADELEGMIAAQLLMTHHAAAECFRRAMLGEQTAEGRAANLAMANKCVRSFATLLEALNRHRGKGTHQKVVVEHVTVQAGGQAIVGNVEGGGGAGGKS